MSCFEIVYPSPHNLIYSCNAFTNGSEPACFLLKAFLIIVYNRFFLSFVGLHFHPCSHGLDICHARHTDYQKRQSSLGLSFLIISVQN